jgi:hypothetical protein
MALSILDGNQSATTLSTILTSGQHITAHTVVSLGTQAITDMRGAVSGSVVSISNFPASQVISGTVTANPTGTQTIAGTVTANVFGQSSFAENVYPIPVNEAGNGDTLGRHIPIGFRDGNGESAIISNTTPLPISGTVTANSSNGSLTTRFGSVTTANTAFATSAVTNANRKYLLIQNITTAANVITVGIGFTPTTTQGIQLFAGAGLTFEGTYIPTGSVNLLSSVTASCYTILEA